MNRKARRLEGIEGSTLAGKEQVWWEILVWLCVFSFLWSSVIFSLYNILVGLFGTILTVFFFLLVSVDKPFATNRTRMQNCSL